MAYLEENCHKKQTKSVRLQSKQVSPSITQRSMYPEINLLIGSLKKFPMFDHLLKTNEK